MTPAVAFHMSAIESATMPVIHTMENQIVGLCFCLIDWSSGGMQHTPLPKHINPKSIPQINSVIILYSRLQNILRYID